MATAATHRLQRATAFGQLTLIQEADDALGDNTGDTSVNTCAERVKELFADRDETGWRGSRNEWFKGLPPVRRGRAATMIVEGFLRQAGMRPLRTKGPATELTVADTSLAVRSSTMWDTGDYRFQSLEGITAPVLAALGVSPDVMTLWLVETSEALRHAGRGRARWVTVNAIQPPAWLTAAQASADLARRLFTPTT